MAYFGQGQHIRRLEDTRLLTGTGHYTDDTAIAAAHAVFVRAQEAHGRITAIDTADAKDVPGVLGVFTCADMDAAGVTDLPVAFTFPNADGKNAFIPSRPSLARDTVRYVGEPVVLIVAETLAAARDAAELVMVDIDGLPAVITMDAAMADGAPVLHPGADSNMLLDRVCYGDEAATQAAFDAAAKVVELDIVNQRLAPTAMEPRSAVVDVDAQTGKLTLYCGTQGSHTQKGWLKRMFGLGDEDLRVVAGDVGGGFGMRLFLHGEVPAVLFAARTLGRAVRWTGDRTEAFLADVHGRDQISRAGLALDADGRVTAVRVHTRRNVGAYLSQFGLAISARFGPKMHCGVYAIPTAFSRTDLICTNTSPTDAYRGAGRPEASYVIERLMDAAAAELQMDPADFRRRNMIAPDAFPYATPLGETYDSGNYPAILDTALKRADVAGFAARRAQSEAAGKVRGLGLSYYIEVCSGGGPDTTWLNFEPDGTITLRSGFQSTGQGHETAYAQITAALLGVDINRIKVVQGDTDRIPTGTGTGGSRSIPVGGLATRAASMSMADAAKAMAAHVWGVSADDVGFDAGLLTQRGSNETLRIEDLAQMSHTADGLPEGVEPGLLVSATAGPEDGKGTFPNGCHVCEVEVDPQTGVLDILRYTVHDDLGTVLNPLLAAGQIHGGIAQGVGQALCEQAQYDPDTGEMLTATFLDYPMPRADMMPTIDFAYTEIPTPNNPLGTKGAGEAGTIGSAAAVVNAALDALRPLGVRAIDMPLTPERVWRAIRDAR